MRASHAAPAPDLTAAFRGKRALVTGGLGFIGSNLAIRLTELGAHVLIADALLDEYGGNPFNIEPVKGSVAVNYCDVRDPHAMRCVTKDQDYVFLCAAQVSHLKSLQDPYADIDINIKGTAVILEALRSHGRDTKIVKLGSRGQYGPVVRLPASEEVKPEPKGIYEISLLAAEHIIRSYTHVHGMKSVLLRLTNIYGPRAQMRHNTYGVANWFMRLALDDQPIPVFGDGSIKRDFLYIDDCLDAVLAAAVCPAADGEVLNVGRDTPSTFLELAKTIVATLGRGRWEFQPFSPERKAQEPGDFYSDIAKIRRLTGWTPKTSLEEGVRHTLGYYGRHKDRYW